MSGAMIIQQTPFALSLSKGKAELVEAAFGPGFASAQHRASTSLSPNGFEFVSGVAA
jgi:hypothetical protein